MISSEIHVLDAAEELAERAAALSFDDLSESEIMAAKSGILDTLGVSLAATGTSSDYLDPFRRYLARAATGKVPAPMLGRRLGELDAILWLGALAHTLDFDDVAGYSHPSAPAVSAALPVAHATRADGRTLLLAVALGQDMAIRLAQSVREPVSHYGWLTSISGVFGAATTTAKLLGLKPAQVRDTFGLALHQTSGTMQALARPGSAYRAVREGFQARAGALCAFLAAEGLPGDDSSLEGQYGFFAQYFDGEYDPDFLRAPALLGPTTSFKPWPCAGHPQLFLTALDELMREGALSVEAITRVHLEGCSDLLPHQCEPLESRAAPTHSIDAKVSIPFLIGTLLTKGTISVEDFTDEGLANVSAVALGRRVTWERTPARLRGRNDYGVGVVTVEHSDGRAVRKEVAFPLGHPESPMTWEQIVEKFRANLASASTDLSDRADALIAAVTGLETLGDAGVILDTLTEGASL